MNCAPQARVGDLSAGHWVGIFYFPPTALIEGSPDTFSCCKSASRVGDKAAMHFAYIYGVVPFPAFKHDGRKAATGASCKYINYKKAFRVGDVYDCGDTQAQGCDQDIVCDECGCQS